MPFVRVVALLLLAMAWWGAHSCVAQEAEGDLVYKFTVSGTQDPVAAKPAQAALMAHGDAHFCYFIDEADVFALVMSSPITRQEIAARLSSAGYTLLGPVLVSDGTVLQAPDPMPSDE
ncbi:MAG: hypothetical protein IPJ76_06140 [Flavobacteriales bacterium]|nr:MAG: hypothetical protein IPJ76_06140 [Flavobacteriales bacterium]